MGGELSRAGLLRPADRHRRPPFGPEHRLPRGRPPGDDGRSRLARRPLPRRGHAPRQGPRRRPHGRPHHLSLRAGAAPEVRPQSAGPRRRRPSRSTPTSRSRATCATRACPSSSASTPIRISTSRARWTISTSRPSTAASWPSAFAAPTTRFCVISFTSDWLFPTSDSRAIVHALNAAAASVGFVEIESDKGHDAFLLDEPEMFAAAARLHRRGRAGAGPP